MALAVSSSSLLNSLLLVFFFISSSFARPNTKAAASDPLVSAVCHEAKNPGFCSRALQSDPRTKTANINVLGQISIDLASSNATATTAKIRSLIQRTSDPRLKFRLTACADHYNGAINDFQRATRYLKSGQYIEVNVAAGGAYTHAAVCEDSFKQPPSYPSPLSTDNLNLELLSDIVAVISNQLSR